MISRAIKTIVHPISGKSFKLGRKRPPARGLCLRLGNYLYDGLPTPPAAVDYSAAAAQFLADVLGNDQLGDCTAAGAFHLGGVFLANAGAPIPFLESDVIKFYSATAGYVPGDEATDQGGDEQTVLRYWRSTGLTPGATAAHQIVGWVSIDGSNADEIRTALYLFENLYFGVELPDAWINPMPSADGFVWDVAGAADQDNGHCFAGVGYDAGGVKIDTWGMLGTVTFAAIAKYTAESAGGELYAVLSADSVAKAAAKAPNGFDLAQLQSDLSRFPS